MVRSAYDEGCQGGYTGPSGLYWLWRKEVWCGLVWSGVVWWDFGVVFEVFVSFVQDRTVWDSGSLWSPGSLRTGGLSRA